MDGPVEDRAQRLADWLTGLGLAESLEAAGLPTFARGADGSVTWWDPGTGDVLDDEGLAALEELLHRQGDDPAYAVPVPLVQLRRRAAVRQRLLADGWHDYAGLAAIRGTSPEATRFAVHRAANRHALLVVPLDERSVVPAFQLDASGEVREELGAVLEPLLAAGVDPWTVWGWLTEPAGLLGGQVPEAAARDPEELPLVRHAAVRLAERSTGDPTRRD